jgi:hypothetical protein
VRFAGKSCTQEQWPDCPFPKEKDTYFKKRAVFHDIRILVQVRSGRCSTSSASRCRAGALATTPSHSPTGSLAQPHDSAVLAAPARPLTTANDH